MINIDANLFTDKEAFYEVFNENFDFDYRVENLDALFDQLLYVDKAFRIINYKMIYKNLSSYGDKVMRVFLDAVNMYDLDIDFISWGIMIYRSKQEEMRDFLAFEIISGKLKNGDKLYAKKFFTNKFKVNPSYVDDAIDLMLKAGFIEKRLDYYYLSFDDKVIARLKDEFANKFINEFLDKMNILSYDTEDAINLLRLRSMANG